MVRTLLVDSIFSIIVLTLVYQLRFFDSVVAIHSSRELAGSPLAVPSGGPREIPSLALRISLDCRCKYRDCMEVTVD